MYNWNVFGVSTVYMYTAYNQGMFVISAQMQRNSLHTFITEMTSILTMSFYTPLNRTVVL